MQNLISAITECKNVFLQAVQLLFKFKISAGMLYHRVGTQNIIQKLCVTKYFSYKTESTVLFMRHLKASDFTTN